MSKVSIHNTEDWELRAFLDWVPKFHKVDCPDCGGRGQVGGGFKDIDGARQCDHCRGRGFVEKQHGTPRPEIPEALLEHMRRAWWDYNSQKALPELSVAEAKKGTE